MRNATRKLAAAIGALAIGTSALGAQTNVQYTTMGMFSGCTTATFNFGGTIGSQTGCVFDGIPGAGPVIVAYVPGQVNVNAPSNTTYGAFLTAPFTGSAMTTQNATFTLTVNQTTPTAGSRAVVGNVSGTIGVNQSNLFYTPGMTNFAIGPVTYRIFTQDGQIAINPPTSTQTGDAFGETTIQGRVTAASVVPEPSTYALLATGIGALGLVARRRRTQA